MRPSARQKAEAAARAAGTICTLIKMAARDRDADLVRMVMQPNFVAREYAATLEAIVQDETFPASPANA